eukprot:jgi/Tetstr1/421654/TSEL_012594.t1
MRCLTLHVDSGQVLIHEKTCIQLARELRDVALEEQSLQADLLFNSKGKHKLKGVREPVEIMEVRGAKLRHRGFPPTIKTKGGPSEPASELTRGKSLLNGAHNAVQPAEITEEV